MKSLALVVLPVAAALGPDISEQEFGVAALGSTGAIFGVAGSRLLRIDPVANNVHVEVDGDTRSCGWSQLLQANGDLWAVPCAAKHAVRISLSGAARFAMDLSDDDVACKWRHAAVASNGFIYAMPWQAASVLVVNPVTSMVKLIPVESATSAGKFGFTAAAAQHICGIPWASRQVLCLHVSFEQPWHFGDLGPEVGKWRTAAANNGVIYALPVEADAVLQIRPAEHSARPLEHYAAGAFKPILLPRWSGGLVDGQGHWLWALPGLDCSLLQVDMPAASVKLHPVACEGRVHSWHSAVVSKNGAIYAVPFSAISVLKVAWQGTTIQAKMLGSFGPSMGKWSHAVLSRAGDVYGVPWAAQKVLKIRPRNDQVSQFGDFEPGPARWKQGVVASNGIIFCIPETAQTVLRIDPSSDTAMQLPWVEPRFMPSTLVTSETFTTTVQVMCLGFKCPASGMLRPDASELVCRREPCFEICCLSSCETFSCPEGYSKKRHARQFSCNNGYCSSTDLLTCCNVDLWYPNVLVPLLIFAFTGVTCVWAQGQRCHTERLSRRRKFSVLYFTVLFAWDVCDQTASWWFWQYTGDVGASFVVQALAMMSAMLGTIIILMAFLAGLFMPTPQLLDHGPELCYSLAAGAADVIMLICAFIFEMEGKDEGSWIKILNLIATLIDFTLKVLQAASALFGAIRDQEGALLDAQE